MVKYNEKECIQTVDNKLIGIAIGQDTDGYFVQTTDLDTHTHLSELITGGLKMKSHAYAIAESYKEKYGMKIFDWTMINQRAIDVLCPECNKGTLHENNEYTEAYCDSCGLEFLLTGELKLSNKEELNIYYMIKDKFDEIVVFHHDKDVFLSTVKSLISKEIIGYLDNHDEELIVKDAKGIRGWIDNLVTIEQSKSIEELKGIFSHCGLQYEVIKE